MTKLTREWVGKAENDFLVAQTLRRAGTPAHEAVCFHCQQCAEKYLKALLQEQGVSVPRTHDLETLLLQVLPHHAGLRRFRRGLVFLTDFAVDTRYPGRKARKRQATAALRWAQHVRATCRTLLDLRPRPQQKGPTR